QLLSVHETRTLRPARWLHRRVARHEHPLQSEVDRLPRLVLEVANEGRIERPRLERRGEHGRVRRELEVRRQHPRGAARAVTPRLRPVEDGHFPAVRRQPARDGEPDQPAPYDDGPPLAGPHDFGHCTFGFPWAKLNSFRVCSLLWQTMQSLRWTFEKVFC